MEVNLARPLCVDKRIAEVRLYVDGYTSLFCVDVNHYSCIKLRDRFDNVCYQKRLAPALGQDFVISRYRCKSGITQCNHDCMCVFSIYPHLVRTTL